MAHRCSVNSSPVELSEFVKVLSQESNWYMLGVHLGVPSCKLDVIERAHTKDFSRCLVELHKSLGKNSLTWEVIASALEKMQNNNLADKIRTEYCVPSTAPLETMNTETTPPNNDQYEMDKIVLKGVPESVNEDVLIGFLDGKLDLEHEIDYTMKLKNSCAVIIFTEQQSAEELDSVCKIISQGKLKRCAVSAERCNSIDVADILSSDKPASIPSGTSKVDGYETDKLLIKAASSEEVLTVFIDGRLDLEHEADYTLIMLKDTCAAMMVFKRQFSIKELNAFSEILSKGRIKGKTVSVHKCQINSPETIKMRSILAAPPKQEYETDQLLITGIPEGVSEDYLATFLDGCLKLDHEVGDYTFKMKKTCALVNGFTQQYSVEDLNVFCETISSTKLRGETLTVTKCQVNCSVLINKIGNKDYKSDDDLLVYFERNKSGTGKDTVQSIVMLSADKAKVTFKEPSVIATILSKDHSKLGPNVSLIACSPLDGLDGSFKEAADPSPPPIDNTPPKTIKPITVLIDRLLAKFLQQKSELLEALGKEIQMSVLLNDGIIELKPTESTPTHYSETSSKRFQSLLSSKVCKAVINVHPEAVKDLYPMLTKRCTSENMPMEFNEDIVSVAGLCESVLDLQKMAEQYCRHTIMTTDQNTLTGEEYQYFTRCSMKHVESKYKGVKIEFTENKDSSVMSFSGSVNDVEQFQQALPSLLTHAKVPLNLSRLVIAFLHKGKGFNILETIIGHASVLPYFSADRLTLSLLCSHDDAQHAEIAAMKIRKEIVVIELELPQYFFTDVANSAKFNDFLQKTSRTYAFLCQVDEMKIKLVCRDQIITKLSQVFEKFAAEEWAITEKIVFKKGVCMNSHAKRDIKEFESGHPNSECIKAMKKKHKDISSRISKLKSLLLETKGKQRSDDQQILSIENSLIKIFKIDPSVWIDTGQNIHKMIKILSDYCDRLSLAFDAQNVSEKQLLENATAGHALTGVLLVQSFSEVQVKRKQIIDCPLNIDLKREDEGPKEEIRYFTSLEEENAYISCLHVLGYKATVQDPAMHEMITHFDYPILEEKDPYESTLKVTVFPAASVTFQMEELKLSNRAMQIILQIEQQINEHGANSLHALAACIRFYNEFGSHVSCGPIVFGGIHVIKCSSSSSGKEILQKRLLDQKQLTSALCIQPGNKLSTDLEKSPAPIQMSLEVITIGGVLTGDAFEWCAGIAANNQTWNAIDGGDNYVSVWDILLHNHIKDLNTCETVAATLKHTFQTLSTNPNFEKAIQFLDTLGLLDTYPDKITMLDAVTIRKESLNKEVCEDPKELPLLLLQKIMSQDCQSRRNLLATSLDDELNISDDELNIHGTQKSSESIQSFPEIHPMDSFLSLFLCSDAFLRQDMLVRIASCQLSVPLITNDPITKQTVCHIWAVQQIIKLWKRKSPPKRESIAPAKQQDMISEKQITEELECPIIQYASHIILFLRIGERLPFSKSKILNFVLSDTKYNHFFHRDCNGGTFPRIISEGVVDMCWYLPGGKTSDVFSDACTFLNLHGNAQAHPKQLKLLQKMASMCFIFIGKRALNRFEIDLILKFSKCVLLLTDEPPINIGEVKSVQCISLVQKNEDKIKTLIRHCVKRFCDTPQHFEKQSIESFIHEAKNLEIKLDKDNDDFRKGKELADKLIKLVPDESIIAKTLLPLQGKALWHKWASKDKEQFRQVSRGKASSEEYAEAMEKEKDAIRSEQKEHVDHLNPFIVQFIAVLQEENKSVVFFFFKCLKANLNNLSRSSISHLQSRYQDVKKKLSAIQQGENDFKVQKTCTEEEKKAQKEFDCELIDTSFGLEHLLREIGQIYEIAHYYDAIDQFRHLPATAAWLLANGYPLEVMDGDAAHLPKQWVQAVVKEAVVQLDNPRIFVLSVLGLQSTGKSTMLNAVFGLQFTVSSGRRCTRGAYMQLFPISKQLKAHGIKCDYVLVVDTKTLRAPELDFLKTQKHDNELATFVIGIADATLINIYGEVPGEMDDIIQTAVHAFIRMKQVKLKPSCQFVHQNASANSKTDIGRDKFTQKLNNMTKEAAQEEGCPGEYERFINVIKFDDQKDVHHFTALWMGDPSMASVNPGYSQNAQILKLALIKMIEETSCKSLDSFQINLGDLWNALLQEKFVFSFKNTLEITAYNSLETVYNRCMLKFKERILAWQETTANEIDGVAVEKLEELVRQKFIIHDSEFKKLISLMKEEHRKELKLYFEESKQADIIVQWRVTFLGKLDRLAEMLKVETEKHCKHIITNKKHYTRVCSEKEQYKAQIVNGVKEIAEKIRRERETLEQEIQQGKVSDERLRNIIMKRSMAKSELKECVDLTIISAEKMQQVLKFGDLDVKKMRTIFTKILTNKEILMILQEGTRLSDVQIKEQFERDWEKLLKNNIQTYTPKNILDVQEDVFTELIDFVEEANRAETEKAWDKIVDRSLQLKIASEHITINSYYTKLVKMMIIQRTFKVEPIEQQAQRLSDDLLQNARKYFEECRRKHSYSTGLTTQILKRLRVSSQQLSVSQDFNFTTTYVLHMYVTACKYAITEFENMVEQFNRKNDPVIWLEEEMKDQLFTLFKNQYNQIAHEEAVASSLCQPLVRIVIKQLKHTLGRIVSSSVSNKTCFQNKGALKVTIMIDLAEDLRRTGDFSKFEIYLLDVKQSMKYWISYYVKQYCDMTNQEGISNMDFLASKEVQNMMDCISNVVRDVNESFNLAERIGTTCWIKKFSENEELIKRFGDTSPLNVSALHEKEGAKQEIELKKFTLELGKVLDTAKKIITKQIPSDAASWSTSPEEFLNDITGCSHQCPFCDEQCDRGVHEESKDIMHTVKQHRPTCVIRGYRDVDTNIMDIDVCSTLVEGDLSFRNKDTEDFLPYKDFQDIYPYWHIPSDRSLESSMYWKWLVANYHKQLGKCFSAESSEIPDTWKKLQWSAVKKDLQTDYNL